MSCLHMEPRPPAAVSSWLTNPRPPLDANIGNRMMRQQPAIGADALGSPVNQLPPEFQRFGRAAKALPFRRAQEIRLHFRSHRPIVKAKPRLNREPHGYIGTSHKNLPADNPAGPLKRLLKRDVDSTLPIVDFLQNEPEVPSKRNVGEQSPEITFGAR